MMSLIGRRLCRVAAFITLVAFLAWSTALSGPSGAQPLELPLGLGAGSGEAEISEDGKQWANLTPVSAPVFASTMIRTSKGLAWLSLHDGTQQIELHECGVVGIYGSRAAAKVVKIAVGRVLFRLPASSETILATPTVQFQIMAGSAAKRSAIHRVGGVPAPHSSDRMGWIIVDLEGNSRIEHLQGTILARPVNGGSARIIEPGQTVEFPAKERGKETDPDFKTLREKKLLCPCVACAAWIPLTPLPVAAGVTGLAVGALAAFSGLALVIGTNLGGPPPVLVASPSIP